MSENQRKELKQWENGLKKWDLQKESVKANPGLTSQFGRDVITYTPETLTINNEYWRFNEGGLSHGYPVTSWFQLAIIYGCGVYTAKEQGILKSYFTPQRFWRHHYFDWTMFLQRSFKFGIVGGLLAGTVLFGNPQIALQRMYSKYQLWMGQKVQDVRDNESNWHVKFNN